MIWRIKYTRTFLKELTVLDEEVRQPIENIAFGEQIKTDPFLSGKVKKLKGSCPAC
ncbi:plasmid stabilization system [Desulfobacca acetoxidans DSM 11109]|uniref:Plasmid stabilization system n=1 Tax=Desulfobacca acetoxidans (strain ATCC 700848 / DSM 11109 / ASRB2) TaxID=880072 RepID=F2NJK5_DESAR|nr:plasmid stabilization system [Desulfobacca acetoxidans DSM 11109]